jgi:hypothetical protein
MVCEKWTLQKGLNPRHLSHMSSTLTKRPWLLAWDMCFFAKTVCLTLKLAIFSVKKLDLIFYVIIFFRKKKYRITPFSMQINLFTNNNR